MATRAAAKAPAKVETVSLTNLVAELAAKHEMSKKDVSAIFADFVDLTQKQTSSAARRSAFRVSASCRLRKRAARMGRNPQTGEPIKIKASKKVAFRVAKDLKDAVGTR